MPERPAHEVSPIRSPDLTQRLYCELSAGLIARGVSVVDNDEEREQKERGGRAEPSVTGLPGQQRISLRSRCYFEHHDV